MTCSLSELRALPQLFVYIIRNRSKRQPRLRSRIVHERNVMVVVRYSPLAIMLEKLPEGFGVGKLKNELAFAIQFRERMSKRDGGIREAIGIRQETQFRDLCIVGRFVPDSD
ncbi:hypothetical protein D3C80_700550 [compost metagenome]